MATRTTTTRATQAAPVPSADQIDAEAPITLAELVQAYFDCRQHKRNTINALAFERDLERNLIRLHEQLLDHAYSPGRSICFIITRPRPREIWAADFRDRIVHHALYNRIAPRFYRHFIVDSCACIPGRGTLYAVQRLESKVRSITQNWKRPAFYLKCDLANFFVAIDKLVLWDLLQRRIDGAWWKWLTAEILFHDPRDNFEFRGDPALQLLVPAHKRLAEQPANLGLPTGNLSSQFFANVYLNELDQFAKHQLRARHYVRYVDDFVLLHESPQWLNEARGRIDAFLPAKLRARLNPKKTVLQPIERGIDFVGQVLLPWHSRTRRRTVASACARVASLPQDDVHAASNSYFGLLRQANRSHVDRARLAHAVLARGHSVDGDLFKSYRRKS
jgi:hypothetical protein